MKTFLLLIATISLATATWATSTDSFQKRVPAAPGGKLVVDVDFGRIEVRTHDGDEVSVEASRTVTLRSEAQEMQFLADRPISLTENDGVVSLRSRKPGGWKWLFGSKLEANYVIQVPVAFAATLETRGGGIQVTGLKGTVRAKTSGGGLRFSTIQGDVHGHTSGGTIAAVGCDGDIVLETSGGTIDVSGGSGSVQADTSGGSIRIRAFQGNAHAETSGGSITLDRVKGGLKASTSGGSIQASLNGPVSDEVELETSGGSITFRVAEGTAFELDAETSGGGVKSEFTVESERKRKRSQVRGLVNGGGKLVTLRTSGGSIHVRKLEKP